MSWINRAQRLGSNCQLTLFSGSVSVWGGNHFWTITGQGDLAAKPSLARYQTGWRFLDYLIENDKKLSFCIIFWIAMTVV